jgi:hypothetical protein
LPRCGRGVRLLASQNEAKHDEAEQDQHDQRADHGHAQPVGSGMRSLQTELA